MSDLNYSINASVTGREEVQGLKDDFEDLDTSAEGIATSGADTALNDLGEAAEGTVGPADRASTAFGDLVAAIGLTTILAQGAEFVMGKIKEQLNQIAQQKAFDAAQVQEFAEALREVGPAAENIVEQLSNVERVIGSVNGTELDITGDLAEANITAQEFFNTLSEDGADGYNTIIRQAEQAGLSEDAVNRIRLAGADILNNLAEGGERAAESNEVFETTSREAAAGARELAEAVGSIEWSTIEAEAAANAMSAFTTQLFAATNEAEARETAFDRLAASIEGVGLNFSATTEAGREQSDALEDVARVIDTDLAQAYDAANGSQAEFIAAATQIGDETLARLQTQLSLTDEQVNTLRNALGLTATDYEARFNLAGAEEARLQLELLGHAIEGLPDDIEQHVNLLITQGDYVAARDVIANFYAGNPVTIPANADTTEADSELADVAEEERETTITADADTVQAATDLLDTADEPRTALIVAHARTAGASIDLKALADEDRTAYIDVATGRVTLPTAASLRNQIGTIFVPIVGRWSTRIEGSRPGP